MAKTFNGVLHLDCNEMSEKYGESPQSWRRQARLGRVPAVSYRRKYFFDPKKVFEVAIKPNNCVMEAKQNAQGAKAAGVDLSDFE